MIVTEWLPGVKVHSVWVGVVQGECEHGRLNLIQSGLVHRVCACVCVCVCVGGGGGGGG